MTNETLITLSDDSLDAVAGGITVSGSVTIPSPKELIGGAVKAVGGVVEAAVSGVSSLLKLFGFGIKISGR